jgi:hypothetical protein
VTVRYITTPIPQGKNLPEGGAIEFAQDAVRQAAALARKGECFVGWYIGHGEGDANTVAAVRKVLGGRNVPMAKDGECKAPRYGFYSCFAGRLNQAVHPANQSAALLMVDGVVNAVDLVVPLIDQFTEVENMFKGMCYCCGYKVNLYIYFGNFQALPQNMQQNQRPQLFNRW